MKFGPYVIGIFIASACGAVLAQESKTYVGGQLSYLKMGDTTNGTASVLAGHFEGVANATQDTSVFAGRIFGGYVCNENVSLELGYLLSGAQKTSFDGVSGAKLAYTGSIKQVYSGADLSVVLRPNRSSQWNGVFAQIGRTALTQKTDIELAGISTATLSDKKSGAGNMWGFGYEMPISSGTTLRLSYTRLGNMAGEGDSVNMLGISYLLKL